MKKAITSAIKLANTFGGETKISRYIYKDSDGNINLSIRISTSSNYFDIILSDSIFLYLDDIGDELNECKIIIDCIGNSELNDNDTLRLLRYILVITSDKKEVIESIIEQLNKRELYEISAIMLKIEKELEYNETTGV